MLLQRYGGHILHFTPSSKLEESSPNEWIPRCHQLLLFYQMPSFDVGANIYYNVPVDHPPSQVTAI